METAFAWIIGTIVGTLVIAAVLLILGFLSFGLLAPIGAIISATSKRRAQSRPEARKAPSPVGRPALHH
jgi:hypothetical protein